jgi:hypothetical protein
MWGKSLHGEQRFTGTIVALSKQFLKLGHLVITGICSAKRNSLFKTRIYRVK